MRSNRFVFQLSPLARLTAATDSGLLPTTNASVANDGEEPETWLARREILKAKKINGNGAGMPLSIAVRMLPTVRGSSGNGTSAAEVAAKNPKNRLETEIAMMLPTPTARDFRSPDKPESGNFQRKIAEGRTIDLNSTIAMLPTPSAGDEKDRGWQWNGSRTGKVLSLPGAVKAIQEDNDLDETDDEYIPGKSPGHKLQPAFAAWMMGFPEDWTESPYLAGDASR